MSRAPLGSLAEKEEFIAYARKLKKLTHRHIVAIEDYGLHPSGPSAEHYSFLVVQYIESNSLRARLAEGHQLAPDDIRRILFPLADALQYANAAHMVHGNLHPGNILHTEKDVFLTDFSLPPCIQGAPTQSAAFLYRAPEHLQGAPTAASDQYSLAVMAYEWLCGCRPYQAGTPEELLRQQTCEPIPAPGTLNPQMKPALEAVLLQALSVDPDARFPHTLTFSDAYLRALMGLPPAIQSSSTHAAQPAADQSPQAAPRERKNGTGRQSATTASQQSGESSPATRKLPEVHSADQSTPPFVGQIDQQITTAPERLHELQSTPSHSSTRKLPENGAAAIEATPEPLPKPPPQALQPVYSSYSDLQRRVEADLHQGGILSHSLAGYEERLAQIEMATVVSHAISENTPAIIEASTGTGKALDVETPIATPTGWKRMGDMVVGDSVFDEQGHPTHVTAAFEVMYNRPCYEVVFSDGSSLIADAEHEWISYACADCSRMKRPRAAVYTEKNPETPDKLLLPDELITPAQDKETLPVGEAGGLVGGYRWSSYQSARNRTLAGEARRSAHFQPETWLTELRDCLAKNLSEQRRDRREYTLVTTAQMAATLTVNPTKRANHAIKVAGALVLPEADLPLAPYLLGAWLADGCSYNNHGTTAGPAILREIEQDDDTAQLLASAQNEEHGKKRNRWQPGMAGRLRALGLIQNKHIPPIYLRASKSQRRALLSGLLDTAGTVNRYGAVEFTTSSPQLAQDVYELVCSLGFRPSIHQGSACLKGKDCGRKWTLAFTTNEQVCHVERRLVAHKERQRTYCADRNLFRYVTDVREVPSRPVRCIQVDAPSHLYLAGRSLIPTHNSLAYLIPVVRSGKIAIVSTANKALQEQLFFKDIPFVQKYIRRFDAALVKGMGNYLCLDRMEQEQVGMQHFARNPDFQRLRERVESSDEHFTGDMEVLGFTLPGDLRSRVNADRDQCTWSKCSYFSDCFVRKMKVRASQASVIVVNHTLLLLDAFMEGNLLPERDVIVIDEAHHLEDEATRAFTTTISQGRVTTLLAQHLLKDYTPPALQDEAKSAMLRTWEQLVGLTSSDYKGRANLKEPLQEGLILASIIATLAEALRTGRPGQITEKDEQLYDKLISRTQNLADDIRAVFAVDRPGQYVYYVEKVLTGGRRGLHQLDVSAAPLEVTGWLKEHLFDTSNVICTSATLATIGPDPARPEVKGLNFAYFRRRVGLDTASYPDLEECILPLTFDYAKHALLYLPRHLPEPAYGTGPAAQEYTRALASEMIKLVEASRGRAFLLFSSKRMLDEVFEAFARELPPHLKFPLLRQGDMTRIELVRSFRAREGAILFGLKSFWEGVDIAGEALSLVVIDKLPFDPPDDPVHEARVTQMKAAGENWFGTYVLPQAVLRLKQGLGRLLRTHDDRGVMAILDTRLHTKGYGKQIVQALPPARRTMSLEAVARFFAEPAEEEAPF
jgi:Rad3-related DNA helicase/serine/threonine protein kinase